MTSDSAAHRFGRLLCSLRGASGLTQAALAKQSGVSRSLIAGIEVGERSVPLGKVNRLSKALGLAGAAYDDFYDAALAGNAPAEVERRMISIQDQRLVTMRMQMCLNRAHRRGDPPIDTQALAAKTDIDEMALRKALYVGMGDHRAIGVIAKALGVSADWILTGEGAPSWYRDLVLSMRVTRGSCPADATYDPVWEAERELLRGHGS